MNGKVKREVLKREDPSSAQSTLRHGPSGNTTIKYPSSNAYGLKTTPASGLSQLPIKGIKAESYKYKTVKPEVKSEVKREVKNEVKKEFKKEMIKSDVDIKKQVKEMFEGAKKEIETPTTHNQKLSKAFIVAVARQRFNGKAPDELIYDVTVLYALALANNDSDVYAFAGITQEAYDTTSPQGQQEIKEYCYALIQYCIALMGRIREYIEQKPIRDTVTELAGQNAVQHIDSLIDAANRRVVHMYSSFKGRNAEKDVENYDENSLPSGETLPLHFIKEVYDKEDELGMLRENGKHMESHMNAMVKNFELEKKQLSFELEHASRNEMSKQLHRMEQENKEKLMASNNIIAELQIRLGHAGQLIGQYEGQIAKGNESFEALKQALKSERDRLAELEKDVISMEQEADDSHASQQQLHNKITELEHLLNESNQLNQELETSNRAIHKNNEVNNSEKQIQLQKLQAMHRKNVARKKELKHMLAHAQHQLAQEKEYSDGLKNHADKMGHQNDNLGEINHNLQSENEKNMKHLMDARAQLKNAHLDMETADLNIGKLSSELEAQKKYTLQGQAGVKTYLVKIAAMIRMINHIIDLYDKNELPDGVDINETEIEALRDEAKNAYELYQAYLNDPSEHNAEALLQVMFALRNSLEDVYHYKQFNVRNLNGHNELGGLLRLQEKPLIRDEGPKDEDVIMFNNARNNPDPEFDPDVNMDLGDVAPGNRAPAVIEPQPKDNIQSEGGGLAGPNQPPQDINNLIKLYPDPHVGYHMYDNVFRQTFISTRQTDRILSGDKRVKREWLKEAMKRKPEVLTQKGVYRLQDDGCTPEQLLVIDNQTDGQTKLLKKYAMRQLALAIAEDHNKI